MSSVAQVFACLSDEFLLWMKLGHVVFPRDHQSRELCWSSPASSSSRVGSMDGFWTVCKGLLKREEGDHDSQPPTHPGTFVRGAICFVPTLTQHL